MIDPGAILRELDEETERAHAGLEVSLEMHAAGRWIIFQSLEERVGYRDDWVEPLRIVRQALDLLDLNIDPDAPRRKAAATRLVARLMNEAKDTEAEPVAYARRQLAELVERPDDREFKDGVVYDSSTLAVAVRLLDEEPADG